MVLKVEMELIFVLNVRESNILTIYRQNNANFYTKIILTASFHLNRTPEFVLTYSFKKKTP